MANAYTEKATETFRMVVSMLGGFGSVPDQAWQIGSGNANTPTTSQSKITAWNGLNAPAAAYPITAGLAGDGTGDGASMTAAGITRVGASSNLGIDLLPKGTGAVRAAASTNTVSGTSYASGLGGHNNLVSSDGTAPTAIGGIGNTMAGLAGNDGHVIIGGSGNNMAPTGGADNNAIIGGSGNGIVGQNAACVILGGTGNALSGIMTGCTVMGSNHIISPGSCSDMLVHGTAGQYYGGQVPYIHSQSGKRLYTRLIYGVNTSNNTPTSIIDASNTFYFPGPCAARCHLVVVGHNNTTPANSVVFDKYFAIRSTSTVAVLLGSIVDGLGEQNAGGYSVTITIPGTPGDGSVLVSVTGGASQTIRWAAYLEIWLGGV
jgi:hypothetical protein